MSKIRIYEKNCENEIEFVYIILLISFLPTNHSILASTELNYFHYNFKFFWYVVIINHSNILICVKLKKGTSDK